MPADAADLETHLLQFRLKSFDFERTARVGTTEYAVFHRTETESESQFRPRLVRLRVVVPREWLLVDLTDDSLYIARDGVTPGARGSGTAVEEGAETSEFVEQGVEWRKVTVGRGSIVYLPKDHADGLAGRAALEALGIA